MQLVIPVMEAPMTFKPAKNTGKKSSPIPTPDLDQQQLHDRRQKWLALVPKGVNVLAFNAASQEEAFLLTWNVATCAHQFMEWTHYQPDQWAAPAWYPERLGRICAWLQAQPHQGLIQRRDDALTILLKAWPQYIAAVQDSQLQYDTIPSLYMPEDLEEFGPLSMPLPYLPHWRVEAPHEDADRLLVRQAAAQVAEEFCLYSGLVTWLNAQVGLDLLDLTHAPF